MSNKYHNSFAEVPELEKQINKIREYQKSIIRRYVDGNSFWSLVLYITKRKIKALFKRKGGIVIYKESLIDFNYWNK